MMMIMMMMMKMLMTRRRSTKEYKGSTAAIVLLDLTRLSLWLHYYYSIYLIETKEQQSGRLRRRRMI